MSDSDRNTTRDELPTSPANVLDACHQRIAELETELRAAREEIAALRQEQDKLAAALDLTKAACEEFVRKCECGEARSQRSYRQMKDALRDIVDPKAIFHDHDLALTGPLVEVLRACAEKLSVMLAKREPAYPGEDYSAQCPELRLADAALAPYKEIHP